MEACGLKLPKLITLLGVRCVTPYGGVWIEINSPHPPPPTANVTPYGGVWIEIGLLDRLLAQIRSHALWRRVD